MRLELETSTALGDKSSKTFPSVKEGEIAIATLAGLSDSGQPLVRCEELYGDGSIEAISTVTIEPRHIGRQVGLMFVGLDAGKPIVVGLMRSQLIEMLDAYEQAEEAPQSSNAQNADINTSKGDDSNDQYVFAQNNEDNKNTFEVDGEKLLLESENEICLRCGDASITLTKAGKIIIRGQYILNRASGLNRIMGGSVDIN